MLLAMNAGEPPQDDLNPRIPLNFRTVIFCFLMGTVLSTVVGMMDFPRPFETPDSWWRVYSFLGIGSFVLLPIWSFFVLRRYKPLAMIDGITFAILVLIGLLFPAL